ncbi:hypothetical protein AVEN_155213-1 [Araneus ventricosus]|uniref:Uncharacterized protein n=1 Tax=Araneus ventricosus TaxID=182803 RepID=A0A4Y2EML4_ARAVE|nr:hypothetical protein AVEN_155213-1 [Araneus ventricosus]
MLAKCVKTSTRSQQKKKNSQEWDVRWNSCCVTLEKGEQSTKHIVEIQFSNSFSEIETMRGNVRSERGSSEGRTPWRNVGLIATSNQTQWFPVAKMYTIH